MTMEQFFSLSTDFKTMLICFIAAGGLGLVALTSWLKVLRVRRLRRREHGVITAVTTKQRASGFDAVWFIHLTVRIGAGLVKPQRILAQSRQQLHEKLALYAVNAPVELAYDPRRNQYHAEIPTAESGPFWPALFALFFAILGVIAWAGQLEALMQSVRPHIPQRPWP